MIFGSNKIQERNWRPDFRDIKSLPDIKIIRTDFVLNLVVGCLAIGLLVYAVIQALGIRNIETLVENLKTDIQKETPNLDTILSRDRDFTSQSILLQAFKDFYQPVFNPLSYMILLANNIHNDLVFDSIHFYKKEIKMTAGSPGVQNNPVAAMNTTAANPLTEKKAPMDLPKTASSKNEPVADQSSPGVQPEEAKFGWVFEFEIDGSIVGTYDSALNSVDNYLEYLSNLPMIKENLKHIEMVSLKRSPGLDSFTYRIGITLNPEKL